MSSRRAIAVLGAATALAGCRAIAGYHDLDYEPAGAATCAPVVLPTSGNGRIRLVNTGTTGAASDFCVRVSGTSDWGVPVFASSKPSCDTGLAYATATVPFAAPSGSIDVEAIAPGGTCTKGATSSATSIAVGDAVTGAPVVTIVRMGGGSTVESVVAHAEDSAASSSVASRLRVVNALSSAQSINIGLAASATLPQTIGAAVFTQAIAPGGVASPGPTAIGAVDAQGYADIEAFGAFVGVVFASDTSAFAAFQTATGAGVHTVFALGDPASNAHPVRGLVCDESSPAAASPDASAPASPLLASCVLTTLPTLAIDTVNASLYGGNAPFEGERRSAVYAKIAARQADVMCVVEAYVNRDGIAAAAKGWYPYVYDIQTDLTTPPTDPNLEDGGVPPAPTTAPCSAVSGATLQSIYACVAKSCSTTGDTTGTLALTDLCLGDACALPFSAIYQHGAQDNACFDCTIDQLTSFDTLAASQATCSTDVRAPFVFAGQASAMILSRYPLANTSAYVLPSTNLRREILYAEVQLEDAPVDFYCSPFSPQYIDADEPYDGVYGQDKTTTLPDGGVVIENGWEDEQDLQVMRYVAFVKQHSAQTGNAAILAGEWYSGLQAAGASGTTEVFNESPEVTNALDSRSGGAFVRADPVGYQPACDYCPAPQNPYNASVQPIDDMATYLFQFPSDSTTEETLWGTEEDVPIHGSQYEPPPTSGLGPAFEYYPREVRVIRPRAQ